MEKLYRKLVNYLYVMPAVIWLILLLAAPLGVIIYYSFLTPDLVTGGVINEFTFDNYEATLARGMYGLIFLKTLGLATATTVICLLLGYPLAYWIVKYAGRWKTLTVFMVITPSFTTYLIRLYAIRTIFQSQGIINSVLLNLGLISSPLQILYTPGAVMAGLVYSWMPLMILPLYAALDGLDPSVLEAAEDLGASGLQKLRTVILPLIKGGIVAGIIFTFVPSLGAWLVPLMLGGAKVMMAGNLVQLHFLAAGNIPMGSAVAVVLTAMIVLILYIAIKLGGKEALERIA